MKKVLFCLISVIAFAFTSCSNNDKISKQEWDEFADMVHNDYVDMTKYHSMSVKDTMKTVDIYIKSGENLKDITVLNTQSSAVEFQFYRGKELVRLYAVRFPKDEKLVSWGKKGIKTEKRKIELNFIQE